MKSKVLLMISIIMSCTYGSNAYSSAFYSHWDWIGDGKWWDLREDFYITNSTAIKPDDYMEA